MSDITAPVIKSSPGADVTATGAVKKQRINYHDDFELVVMRWRELERSLAKTPDLRAKYQRYDHTIRAAASAFFSNRKYRNVLLANGHDEGDLYSFGRLWMVNYLLYERPAEADLAHDNEKLLFTHLQQRMTEMVGTVFKKAKNCLPDRDAAVAFSLGGYSESVARAPRGFMEELIDDKNHARRNKKINTSERHRAPSARRLLIEQLARLDHAAMIETLGRAAHNHPDCTACSGKQDKLCAVCNKLCADSRDAAAKLFDSASACAPAAPCVVCKTKERDMDKRVTPIIRDPKSSPATLSVPQANSLSLVRLMVESVVRADSSFELKGGTAAGADPRTARRAVTYYKQAARVLGFLATNKGNEWSPTRWGFELIGTAAGSHDERLMFRERITVSPPLEQIRWFFVPPNDLHGQLRALVATKPTPKARLVAELDFLTAELVRITRAAVPARLSEETARRRASTLVHWRDYAWDAEQLSLIEGTCADGA